MDKNETYVDLAHEVKAYNEDLGSKVFELGCEMESEIIDMETKKQGIQEMLKILEVELEEIEKMAIIILKEKKGVFHSQINRIQTLIQVTSSYNEK